MADKLIEVFSEGLGVPADRLDDSSAPDNTEEWDSLAAMQLVTLLEDTFEVRLSTREIMKMNTIGTARAVLRSKGIEGL